MLRPHRSPNVRPLLVGTTLVAMWITVPLLTVAWLMPRHRDLASTAAVAELVVYPVLLMAALLLYARNRVASDPAADRVTAAMVFAASQGAGCAALRLADPTAFAARPGWMMLVEVPVAVALLVLLLPPADRRLPGDPLVAGLLLGLAVTGVRIALLAGVEPSSRLHELRPWLAALALLLYAVAALSVARRGPRRAMSALAAVVVLVGISRVLTAPAPPDDLRSLAAVVGDLLAAVVFATTAWRLLGSTLRHAATADEALHGQLEMAEAAVREDRTVLHEVASTVAGITSASRLLTSTHVLDARQRERLLGLLAAEAARLERLAAGRSTDATAEVDVDAALEPVLVAQAARGRRVAWRPSGHRALGSADQIAEVVGILLDNCADHAASPSARVDVTHDSGSVAITVSDAGRGMPGDLVARAFDWGVSRPGSRGQGIGLPLARELAERQRGRLALTSDPVGGTVVTLSLPAVPDPEGAHEARRA